VAWFIEDLGTKKNSFFVIFLVSTSKEVLPNPTRNASVELNSFCFILLHSFLTKKTSDLKN